MAASWPLAIFSLDGISRPSSRFVDEKEFEVGGVAESLDLSFVV